MTAGEVALEDSLGTVGIADLGVNRGTGHVRHHSIATAPRVLSIAERVVLRSGLGEPDVTAVASQLTRLDGFGNVLLDDNGTTGSVDEPSACMNG